MFVKPIGFILLSLICFTMSVSLFVCGVDLLEKIEINQTTFLLKLSANKFLNNFNMNNLLTVINYSFILVLKMLGFNFYVIILTTSFIFGFGCGYSAFAGFHDNKIGGRVG